MPAKPAARLLDMTAHGTPLTPGPGAIAPKAVLQLSEEGPLVFGGEATGAATTDGTLVLPDRIALLLHELLPVGLPVVIAP